MVERSMLQIRWQLKWAALSVTALTLTMPVKHCQSHEAINPSLVQVIGEKVIQTIAPHPTPKSQHEIHFLLNFLVRGLADVELALSLGLLLHFYWSDVLSPTDRTQKSERSVLKATVLPPSKEVALSTSQGQVFAPVAVEEKQHTRFSR